MKPSTRRAALTAGIFLGLCGCSQSSDTASPGSASFAPTPGTNNGAAGLPAGQGGNDTIDAASALPPEVKAESDYQSPVATGKIVWIANPTSGRVAYVDATSFNVQTVQAGDGPTYLAAVPNLDPSAMTETAIVLNVRSHDATLLRRDAATGRITPTMYPSTADANTWAISPSGRWAIAWTDARTVSSPDPTQGFQDIAVLDLASGATADAGAPILAVGYRPTQVVFARDETRAFVVTQDGISVVLLGAGHAAVTRNFPLSAPAATAAPVPDAMAPDATTPAPIGDASADQMTASDSPVETSSGPSSSSSPNGVSGGAPDVSFTPDGLYALVRQEGVPAITVLSLADGTPARVALPATPTDLTVSADGTFAVAVLRDTSTVAILPLPAIAGDPSAAMMIAIPGETVGRAVLAPSPASPTRILLFTTAAAVPRLIVLTLLPKPSYRTVALHAPVRAVFATTDGQHAIVLHATATSLAAGPGSNPPPVGSSGNGAFSIVPIAQDLPAKIVSLTAPPVAVALAPAGDRALVTVSDGTSTFGAELAEMPSLEVIGYALASPPTAVGIAGAAGKGFVAQNYPDGRITLIDLNGGAARTITGFELGAGVVQGGTP